MARQENRLQGVSAGEPVEVLARRPKPKPRRDRSWDARRKKMTYDLPEGLISRIREIAETLAAKHPGARIRHSDIARLLLEAGLERYEAGELQIELHPIVLSLFPVASDDASGNRRQ